MTEKIEVPESVFNTDKDQNWLAARLAERYDIPGGAGSDALDPDGASH